MRSKADFDRAYSQGRRIPSASFTVITCSVGLDHPRLGVTISRRVGGAVVRNAVRRRLREAFRRNHDAISVPVDLVLQVKPAAAGACYADLEAEFLKAVRRLGAGHGKAK
jgi:ribonuclease P protein component